MLATAIEIIHTASLVHDDILDDADTRSTEGKEARLLRLGVSPRRQQQTMHRIFGPDVAAVASAECQSFWPGPWAPGGGGAFQVLSGDFLFAHASGLIESLEDDEVRPARRARSLSSPPGPPSDR